MKLNHELVNEIWTNFDKGVMINQVNWFIFLLSNQIDLSEPSG